MDAHPLDDLHYTLGRWHQVGSDLIIFKNTYEANQLWFSFANTIIFQAYEADDHRVRFEPWFAPGGFSRGILGSEVPDLIPPKEGVPQYYLPFNEYRHITGRDLECHYNANFPYFDLNEEGASYEVEVDFPTFAAQKVAVEWCLENLEGRFVVEAYFIMVEQKSDFLMLRLKY